MVHTRCELSPIRTTWRWMLIWHTIEFVCGVVDEPALQYRQGKDREKSQSLQEKHERDILTELQCIMHTAELLQGHRPETDVVKGMPSDGVCVWEESAAAAVRGDAQLPMLSLGLAGEGQQPTLTVSVCSGSMCPSPYGYMFVCVDCECSPPGCWTIYSMCVFSMFLSLYHSLTHHTIDSLGCLEGSCNESWERMEDKGKHPDPLLPHRSRARLSGCISGTSIGLPLTALSHPLFDIICDCFFFGGNRIHKWRYV